MVITPQLGQRASTDEACADRHAIKHSESGFKNYFYMQMPTLQKIQKDIFEKAIFFDVGGVLMSNDSVPFSACLERVVGRPFREFRRSAVTYFYTRNTIDQEAIAGFCEELGLANFTKSAIEKEVDCFKSEKRRGRLYPDVEECLSALSAANTIGVISNSTEVSYEPLEQFGIARYLSCEIFSHIVGVAKPSYDIFKLALDNSKHVAKGDCIFVTDQEFEINEILERHWIAIVVERHPDRSSITAKYVHNSGEFKLLTLPNLLDIFRYI